MWKSPFLVEACMWDITDLDGRRHRHACEEIDFGASNHNGSFAAWSSTFVVLFKLQGGKRVASAVFVVGLIYAQARYKNKCLLLKCCEVNPNSPPDEKEEDFIMEVTFEAEEQTAGGLSQHWPKTVSAGTATPWSVFFTVPAPTPFILADNHVRVLPDIVAREEWAGVPKPYHPPRVWRNILNRPGIQWWKVSHTAMLVGYSSINMSTTDEWISHIPTHTNFGAVFQMWKRKKPQYHSICFHFLNQMENRLSDCQTPQTVTHKPHLNSKSCVTCPFCHSPHTLFWKAAYE